jgi:hypothetical protein
MFGLLIARVLNADILQKVRPVKIQHSIKLERTAIAANSPTVATKEIQDATINACGDKNRCANRKIDIHVRRQTLTEPLSIFQ